jgi:hypothetical protein
MDFLPLRLFLSNYPTRQRAVVVSKRRWRTDGSFVVGGRRSVDGGEQTT